MKHPSFTHNLLAAIRLELEARGAPEPIQALKAVELRCSKDIKAITALAEWLEGGATTTKLHELARLCGDLDHDMAFFNAVCGIDAATIPACEKMAGTRRTVEGRLFPSMEIGDWRISAQAAAAGYQCQPKANLDLLEEYSSMEVVIYNDNIEAVDPAELGLRDELLAKFTPLEDPRGVSIGCNLSWSDIAELRMALHFANSMPLAGVSRRPRPADETENGMDMLS